MGRTASKTRHSRARRAGGSFSFRTGGKTLALLALGLAVAGIAGLDAARNVPFASAAPPWLTGPETALRGFDARLTDAPRSVDPARLRDTSLAVLREDPLDARALRLLAVSRETRGEGKAALFLAIAQRVSKRDLGVNLWAIEDRVAAGDIAGALAAYDRALRTAPASRQVLFPRLADAVADPLIAAKFGPLLAADPPWMAEFLGVALTRDSSLGGVATLAMRSRGFSRVAERERLLPQLIVALTAQARFDDARKLLAFLPGADAAAADGLAISKGSTDGRLGPLAWQVVSGPGVDARIRAADGQAPWALIVSSGPGGGGTAFAKTALLPAGRYRLSFVLEPLGGTEPVTGRFVLRCLSAAPAPLLELAGPAGRPLLGNFEVDQGCRAQIASIAVDPPSGQQEASVAFSRIAVAPLDARQRATGAINGSR